MNSIKKIWTFFNATTTGEGTPLILTPDKVGSKTAIQVYSDNGALYTGRFQAKLFQEANWANISVTNDNGIVKTGEITSDGIYTLSLTAYVQIRFLVTSVSGGNLTVKGKVY